MAARLAESTRPLALMHLRKGILGHALAPRGRDGEPLEPPRAEPPDDFRGERFGVAPEVQALLSKVRTDLDSFSEIEAYSLMVGGYRQTGPNVEHLEIERAGTSSEPHGWRFGVVAAAAEEGRHEGYLQHLGTSSSRFGKALRLSGPARLLAAALALGVLLALVLLLLVDGVRDLLTADIPVWAVFALGGAVLLLAFLYLSARLPGPVRWFSDALFTQVFPVLFALPLWISAILTLAFSRMFVTAGRAERVLGRG